MIQGIKFDRVKSPASREDIRAIEAELNICLPESLKWVFLNANGGRPVPSIFPNVTDVHSCLALNDQRGSLRANYHLLVTQKKAAPASFLPFAEDSGGNVFFVDCADPGYGVYLLTHETVFRLVPLNVDIDSFWGELTTIDEAFPGRG
jgi:cell wall assembly regulator SMI1